MIDNSFGRAVFATFLHQLSLLKKIIYALQLQIRNKTLQQLNDTLRCYT